MLEVMTTTQPAEIVTRRGRTWWTCPGCGKTLAEIAGRHVVIKIGPRYLMIALANDQLQRCPDPRCATESVLRAARVA